MIQVLPRTAVIGCKWWIHPVNISVRIYWIWRQVGLGKGRMTKRARERLGWGVLAGNSSWISNLRDWDGSWVYSDIINKERNVGRGIGFMKKIMSCNLVRSVSEKIQSKGTEVLYSSPLKCSCFLWKKAEYEGQAVKPNNKSNYYSNIWIWSELRCIPLHMSNLNSSTYVEPGSLVYLFAYLLTTNLTTGRHRGHYFQFVDEKLRHNEFKRLAWNHIKFWHLFFLTTACFPLKPPLIKQWACKFDHEKRGGNASYRGPSGRVIFKRTLEYSRSQEEKTCLTQVVK